MALFLSLHSDVKMNGRHEDDVGLNQINFSY